MMGGNMMSKMSSKFGQLQARATGSPTAGQPGGNKPPTDWKKWAKRGAIGVAGIGALAIGADCAGDMFSGAEGIGGDFGGGEDFSGGGEDFSGGGFEGGDAGAAMDAQTAVDANAAENAMAGVGQENAQMYLDPVGTECEYLFPFLCWWFVFAERWSRHFHLDLAYKNFANKPPVDADAAMIDATISAQSNQFALSMI